MHRCVALVWIIGEIYDVAVAMLDGSYWREDTSNQAHDDARDVASPHYWD